MKSQYRFLLFLVFGFVAASFYLVHIYGSLPSSPIPHFSWKLRANHHSSGHLLLHGKSDLVDVNNDISLDVNVVENRMLTSLTTSKFDI